MDKVSLIHNRKSAREFTNKAVTQAQYDEIIKYYHNECDRLFPEIETELILADEHAKRDLTGVAGYQQKMIGAPGYLLLLSEDVEGGIMNASYMAEDMVLKMMEMGLGCCYITFADGESIKGMMEIESDKKLAIIIAFGNEERLAKKKMRFNFKTMKNVTNKEKMEYYDPKKRVLDLIYIDTWGNQDGLEEAVNNYGNILWDALYCASLAPSYLNRQPYAFILHEGNVVLVSMPDEFTDEVSEQQNLGIVMLHFDAAADQLVGSNISWHMDITNEGLNLPEGYKAVAYSKL